MWRWVADISKNRRRVVKIKLYKKMKIRNRIWGVKSKYPKNNKNDRTNYVTFSAAKMAMIKVEKVIAV